MSNNLIHLILKKTRKASNNLGEQWSRGIPIEVIPSAYRVVYQKIEKTLGGKSELRMSGSSKAVSYYTDIFFKRASLIFPVRSRVLW